MHKNFDLLLINQNVEWETRATLEEVHCYELSEHSPRECDHGSQLCGTYVLLNELAK